MRRPARFCLLSIAGVSLAAATLIGCTSSGTGGNLGGNAETSSSGTSTAGGGTSSNGGLPTSGGATVAGSLAGSGGLAGSAGVAGSAGAAGAAGTAGSRGLTSLGGLTTSGGALASGGSSGTSAGGTADTGGLTSTPATGGSGAAGTGGGKGGSTANGGLATGGGIATSGGTTASGGITATGGLTTSGGATATGGTASACPPVTALTGGKQYCSNAKGNVSGGYSYELWAEGSGTGCMTVHGVDGAFSATWNDVEDFLARVGLQFDQTKTPAQIGTISSDFAETKTASSGLVYVGIYGWTVSPLVEYYILDDWGSTKPADTASDGTPRTKAGTIDVDGETYDVYTHERVNKPAITGDNKTFQQYFSIRRTARTCGHISISEHFSKWAGLGLSLGKLFEAKLLLEAQNGSGTIAFSKATVVVK
jgi:endo-1,4-beta-xylanase